MMKVYPEYKDARFDSFGKIPSHWTMTTVRYFYDVKLGKMLDSNKQNEDDVIKPYVRAANIHWNRILLDEVGVNEMGFSESQLERYALQPGDLLVTEGGVTVGRSAIWNSELMECYYQNSLNRVRALKGSSTTWLYYWMYFVTNNGFIDILADKSTFGHLTNEKLRALPIPIPPLSEQRAIADFLDRKTAQIDTLIEKKQRQIDLLQEQRTALINHAVTKGLNPNVKMKDSGVEWLGEIPSHWIIVKLKYISPNVTVGIVITPAKYYVDNGVPCLRSLNVKERKLLTENLVYISSESNELLKKSKIYSGDLVSVRTGQPGTTAVVDERFDGANCIDLIITRQSKDFDSQFLAYQLNSSLSKAQYTTGSSGAIQQHFNVETASNMLVVLPPLDEQIEIRKKLDLAEKRDEDISNNIGLMIQYLQEYRTALISEAVTGKIDVR